MKQTLINTGYIASGNGTDFRACMEAYLKNRHKLLPYALSLAAKKIKREIY